MFGDMLSGRLNRKPQLAQTMLIIDKKVLQVINNLTVLALQKVVVEVPV